MKYTINTFWNELLKHIVNKFWNTLLKHIVNIFWNALLNTSLIFCIFFSIRSRYDYRQEKDIKQFNKLKYIKNSKKKKGKRPNSPIYYLINRIINTYYKYEDFILKDWKPIKFIKKKQKKIFKFYFLNITWFFVSFFLKKIFCILFFKKI